MDSKPLISEDQIKEFIKIYEEEFGKKISIQDAYEKGFKLVALMALLYKAPDNKTNGTVRKDREGV
ncbi:MAG TPA: hypothetical protein PKU96_03795 [bacterium]|nr:hypothetical protein [bacterium]